MRRLAAHGHSMGGFATGALIGSHPALSLVASHYAAGMGTQSGAAARSVAQAQAIRAPYSLHHGDVDTVVPLALDQGLANQFAANPTTHQLTVYPGFTHSRSRPTPACSAPCALHTSSTACCRDGSAARRVYCQLPGHRDQSDPIPRCRRTSDSRRIRRCCRCSPRPRRRSGPAAVRRTHRAAVCVGRPATRRQVRSRGLGRGRNRRSRLAVHPPLGSSRPRHRLIDRNSIGLRPTSRCRAG